MKRYYCLISAVLLAMTLSAQAAKLPVVTSFSILGDLVQQVGGDKVEVRSLVGPDGDAHVYQPSPQDGKTLAGARLLVINGLAFEGWMERLARASKYQGATVVASAGIRTAAMAEDEAHEEGHDHRHDHGKTDPHAWQDPANVRQYVANIAAALGRADPANAGYYQQRAQAYQQELKALEQWAQAQLAGVPAAKRRVITSHDAFGYLGRRFQIDFLAPQGMNTEAEASAKDVGMLIRQARRDGIRAIFVENVSNPKLLEQISRETGAKVGGRLYSDALSRADGPAASYLAMMRYNISTLLAGLRQN